MFSFYRRKIQIEEIAVRCINTLALECDSAFAAQEGAADGLGMGSRQPGCRAEWLELESIADKRSLFRRLA